MEAPNGSVAYSMLTLCDVAVAHLRVVFVPQNVAAAVFVQRRIAKHRG